MSGLSDSLGGGGLREVSCSIFGGSTSASTATQPESLESVRQAHAYHRFSALSSTAISLNAPMLSMTGCVNWAILRPPPS